MKVLQFQTDAESNFDEEYPIYELTLTNEEVRRTVFSYFDTGKGKTGDEPERFYHGFVLGIIVSMSKEYHIRSSRESGFGRYDIMIYPKNSENSLTGKKNSEYYRINNVDGNTLFF